jgi:hypothetical protein
MASVVAAGSRQMQAAAIPFIRPPELSILSQPSWPLPGALWLCARKADGYCNRPRTTPRSYPHDSRYYQGMTGLLEEALRRVESLSPDEQDAIAAQIIETLDDEEAWERSFRQNPSVLRSLADEALAEHRRGETRPLDELIG